MSGGSFQYAFYKVREFCDELELKLEDNTYDFGSQGIELKKEMKSIKKEAKVLAELMKEVEWFYSGDTGGSSFLRRVREIRNDGQTEQTEKEEE